nr:MAG TPA: hypothetical protein [Caudoviricetes sp.]
MNIHIKKVPAADRTEKIAERRLFCSYSAAFASASCACLTASWARSSAASAIRFSSATWSAASACMVFSNPPRAESSGRMWPVVSDSFIKASPFGGIVTQKKPFINKKGGESKCPKRS